MIPIPVIYSVEDAAIVRQLAEDASVKASSAKAILEGIEIPKYESRQEYPNAIFISQENGAEPVIKDTDKIIDEQAEKTAKAIAAAARAMNTDVSTPSNHDSYPYAKQCPDINWRYTGIIQTAYGGALCECTGYAGWKAQEYWGYAIPWASDASGWGAWARAYGLRVDSNPAPHTIGVQYAGIWGHVVWIEHVNGDGTVDISEYNNTYSSGNTPNSYGYQTGVPAFSFSYIHFD